MKNNKIKIGIIALIAVVVVIAVVVIVSKVFFGGTDVEKKVPKEALQYKMLINGKEDHICKIDSFEIEKRDKTDEYDTAYCKIEMSDQYIARTTYLRMELKKYEEGGWLLESYSEYKKEKISIKDKESVGKSAAENYAKDLILTKPICKFVSEDEMKVSYTPFIEHRFLKFKGQIVCDFKLETNEHDLPHNYQWGVDEYDIDYSKVSYSWDINGKWKGKVGSYDVKLAFRKNSDTNYTIHGTADKSYEDDADVDILLDDSDTHTIPLEKEEYEAVKVGFYISYPGFNLFITPKTLEMAESDFMFTSTIDSAVELTQY